MKKLTQVFNWFYAALIDSENNQERLFFFEKNTYLREVVKRYRSIFFNSAPLNILNGGG